MLLKLLGLLDLFAGITLFVMKFGVGRKLSLILGILLLIKGVLFITTLASIPDLITGVIMVAAASGSFHIIYLLFALWLLQKGLFSLYS